MKWFSVIPVLAFAFVFNACEKHPASQLPPEHATAFGEHAWPSPGGKEGTAPAGEASTAAKPEAAAPVADGKPGDAPKFFPENK